jgi:NADH-quinone oxidoreductase subunit F
MMRAFLHGQASKQEVQNLQKTASNMMGQTICAFADAAAMPVLGFLKKFPEEFEKIGGQV